MDYGPFIVLPDKEPPMALDTNLTTVLEHWPSRSVATAARAAERAGHRG
jgi:hypothetical protein